MKKESQVIYNQKETAKIIKKLLMDILKYYLVVRIKIVFIKCHNYQTWSINRVSSWLQNFTQFHAHKQLSNAYYWQFNKLHHTKFNWTWLISHNILFSLSLQNAYSKLNSNPDEEAIEFLIFSGQ